MENSLLEPVLELPFHLRGHDGVALVNYGVDEETDSWDFGLQNEPVDRVLVRSFPLMLATVTNDGSRYQTLIG